MFLPGVDLDRRVALFSHVSFILFQYQYVKKTLKRSLPGVQNLPVVTCAIGSIYLLGRKTRCAFAGPCASMVPGMASSRNEFFHWARRDISTADETDAYTTRGVEFNGYAVRLGICVSLQQMATQSTKHQSILTALMLPQFTYLLGFLGSPRRFPVKAGAIFSWLCALRFHGMALSERSSGSISPVYSEGW